MPDFVMRRGRLSDRDLIVEALAATERGGLERSLYELAFDLSMDGLRGLLGDALDADVPAGELAISSYWILEQEGQPVALRGSWVEEPGGAASSFMKAMVLRSVVGAPAWERALPRLKALGSVDIPRRAGCVQIECCYVVPARRGQGLGLLLDVSVLGFWSKNAPAGVDVCQGLTVSGNEQVSRLLQKLGFTVTKAVDRSDLASDVAAFVPWRGRQLWERGLGGPYPLEPLAG